MTARPLPAAPVASPVPPQTTRSQADWAAVARVAPQLAATAWRYLTQIEISQRPNTILKADETLRSFCGYLTDAEPAVTGFAQVTRIHVEGYKLALAGHVTAKGTPLAVNTLRQRLGMLRSFFERIIEWGWDDAPARMPIFSADLPLADEPLPKALDDAAAARFLQAAAGEADPLRALVVELLARTGMRVGELCALEADALSQRAGGWWLKIPVGKLRNDRYIPVHPRLLELLQDWQARHDPAGTGLLLTNAGRPLNRHVVTRMVRRVARNAGIGHIHPHQLRHTLGTQAINRGMRIEAIAELLGHRSLKMTLRYSRIANETVAAEYHAANAKVDALYAEAPPLPETPGMRRLRQEHRRMLGNGWCTRPAELDCRFETLCEGCGFFATTVEFKPTLTRQRDHAATHDQLARAGIYQHLIDDLEDTP